VRKINRVELERLTMNNVCEIMFVRRRPERAKGRPLTRRMLCTNSKNILLSPNGRISLNYDNITPGKRQAAFKIDRVKHNVVVAYDIIMQEYRNISMDACFLVNQLPDNDTFWKYFDEVLLPASPQDKQHFMDNEYND